MRARTLLLLGLGMVAATHVRAQIDSSGLAGQSERPGVTLAQFQPGLSPLGSNLDLAPGQPVRLALYCADLFADTPTNQVAFTAPGSEATVTMASGLALSLGEALEAGLLQARGRGPGDPPHRPGGQWFDLYLTSLADQPLRVTLPAGTLLVPAGQKVPDVRPSVRRLFAAARQRGLLGSDTLAHAVWATRGFTREDVEQTSLTPLADAAAGQVQELLAAADLGHQFDRGRGDYVKLFDERRAGLREAAPVNGSALLPHGKSYRVEILADAAGEALVALEPGKGSARLLYAGRVTERRADRLTLELRHLKTGRPLEAARGPILVRLAAQVARS